MQRGNQYLIPNNQMLESYFEDFSYGDGTHPYWPHVASPSHEGYPYFSLTQSNFFKVPIVQRNTVLDQIVESFKRFALSCNSEQSLEDYRYLSLALEYISTMAFQLVQGTNCVVQHSHGLENPCALPNFKASVYQIQTCFQIAIFSTNKLYYIASIIMMEISKLQILHVVGPFQPLCLHMISTSNVIRSYGSRGATSNSLSYVHNFRRSFNIIWKFNNTFLVIKRKFFMCAELKHFIAQNKNK